MFSGTLRENIDPFVRYSDAAVAKAVHDCGLEGRSLDAVVGVSGEKFSLGEEQLVCRCSALRWCRTRIEMGTGKLLSISDFNPGSAAASHH